MDETPTAKTARERLALSRKRSRRRGWVWFFVILAVLAAIAVTIQIWYGNRSQLTPEQLARAEALWRARGPANYDMSYTVRKLNGDENYAVKVRNGRAISVHCNDQLVEERLFRYSEMPALFSFIEEFMQQDSEPGKPRTFVRATFDPED